MTLERIFLDYQYVERKSGLEEQVTCTASTASRRVHDEDRSNNALSYDTDTKYGVLGIQGNANATYLLYCVKGGAFWHQSLNKPTNRFPSASDLRCM